MRLRRTALAILLALGPGCARETELGRFLVGGPCEGGAIDPTQLTALGPNGRSHWLQPWRAYRDTWPAERMRRAAGMSLGSEGRRAALVREAGFGRGMIAIGWAAMSYDQPDQIGGDDRDRLRRALMAARAAGLRPLLALDGNQVAPVPSRGFDVTLTEPAARGAREVRIDAASARQILPGRSGLNLQSRRAGVLFTTADGATGRATLSRPLPEDLPAGAHRAATLRFAPFGRPTREDGSVNPRFEDAVAGWVQYAAAFAREARDVLGDEEFDLELWNELKQGSDFLDVNNYYDPPIERWQPDAEGIITAAIVERTVRALRPQFPRIGIGDGFGNTRWQTAAAIAVDGITAVNRHVSVHGLAFPGERFAAAAVDARGRETGGPGGDGLWDEPFTPTYDVSFVELPLTAIAPQDWTRPGQLVRDLAPLPTVDADGVPRGRAARPPQTLRPPELWLTAVSWSPSWAAGRGVPIGPADIPHLQAKSALRALSAYVGAGASLLVFYAPTDGRLTLIDWDAPGGGPVVPILRRFFDAFEGPALDRVEPLTLVGVTGCGGRQFEGDGSAAHPALENRDVVAAFPFQRDARSYVIPVYVMTRHQAQVHRPDRADPTRFDLPPERYVLTFAGPVGADPEIAATDPLTGATVPARRVGEPRPDRVLVELELTDAPRLLVLRRR